MRNRLINNVRLVIFFSFNLACNTSEINNSQLDSNVSRPVMYQSDLKFEGVKGNVSKIDYFEFNNEGKLRRNKTTFYNFAGNIDSTNEKTDSGEIRNRFFYIRDSLDRLTILKNETARGEFILREYDYSNPLEVVAEYFLSSRSATSDGWLRLVYNSVGNLVSLEDHESSGAILITDYQYKGDLIVGAFSRNKSSQDSIVTIYIEGDISSITHFKNGEISVERSYEYEKFDDNKNWIEASLVVDYKQKKETFESVLRRDIEYY